MPNFQIKNVLNILGRLLAANQKPIEIRQINFYFPGQYNFSYSSLPLFESRLMQILKHRLNSRPDFEAIYMIYALLSRGAHVKDQLLVDSHHQRRFIECLKYSYSANRKVSLLILKLLMSCFF